VNPQGKQPGLRYTFADKQIVRPRVEHGCDWERVRVVLARDEREGEETAGRELWWMKPGKTWGGVGQERRYVRAELATAAPEASGGVLGFRTKTLQEGGHIGTHMLLSHREKIEDHFGGARFAEAVVPWATLIILPWEEPPEL
jgi:hypothetical protein